MSQEIETLNSETVYSNRWMTVREDRIRRADGSDGIYGVVEKVDYVLIVPFDGVRVHLVEQYRYAVGGRYWDFPQGAWETRPDVEPATVAAGELAEETGLRAASLVELGVLFQAYGYSNQSAHIYLATELTAGERSPEPEEQGLRTEAFTLDELRTMITDGTIRDVTSVAATHLFFQKLNAA